MTLNQNKQATTEALELLKVMLETEPGADLAFLAETMHTCPECKSANTSPSDKNGLRDCLDCGVWFKPSVRENVQEAAQEESDSSADDFSDESDSSDEEFLDTAMYGNSRSCYIIATHVKHLWQGNVVGEPEEFQVPGTKKEFAPFYFEDEDAFITAVATWLLEHAARTYTYMEDDVYGGEEDDSDENYSSYYRYHLVGFTPHELELVYDTIEELEDNYPRV